MAEADVGAAGRQPQHDRYDIVVVGARVAGAATAMLLARCGYEVLLIDRGVRGSDTVSTHTLLRSGVLQMKRWNLLGQIVDAGTPPIGKVTLGFGADLIPIELSADFGVDSLFAPRRLVLDPIIQAAAEGAGVEFSDRTRAFGVDRDGTGRVIGVTVGSGSWRKTVGARYVIGADGAKSKMAELFMSRTYQYHEPANAVRYAYYEGDQIDGVHFQFTPGVTSGLIPTNDGLVCVYLGLPLSGMTRTEPHDDFAALVSASHPELDRFMSTAVRVSPFRGTPGLPGFLRGVGGPGWALVGDAGYCKDPVSAHGISSALRDSELCARAVDSALQQPRSASSALVWYQRTRDQVSVSMLKTTQELAEYRWDSQRASDLMRGISISVKRECEMIESLAEWRGCQSLNFVG